MNEDWDDMAMAEPLAGEELERMLARYSRVRLDPSHAQAKRARTAVMEAAWRRRIEASQVVPSRPARQVPFSGWGVRRFGASLTAAMFAGLMIGTSVFAASRAGGPLYETRLAVEELGYPGEAGARVDAQVRSAEARLFEALVASGHQDGGGTSAALRAYDRTLADLENATGPAADRALAAIQFHHGVLEEIATKVPEDAVAGLDRALANSERLIDKLGVNGTGTPSSGSGGTGPGNGAGNGQGNGPGSLGNPEENPGNGVGPDGTGSPTGTEVTPTPKPIGKPTDDPAATPKPTKEPRPTATPEPAGPAATDRPDRTPRPRPSHAGGPGGNGGQDEQRTPRGGPQD